MKNQVHLKKKFDKGAFRVGASVLKQGLWYITDIIIFRLKIIPSSSVLVFFLRLFGSNIGPNVRIKPGIQIKYPWKLYVGSNSWLADCYIDNLESVFIGENCCISQGARLITGNHDYTKSSFDLITCKIKLENGVWIAAGAMIGPGVTAYEHSVLALGSVISKNMESYKIYKGNPAVIVSERIINQI